MMQCPACRRPGAEMRASGAPSPLFACENPDCSVEAFDAQGAQSVEAPGAPRPTVTDASGDDPSGC